MGGGPEGAVLLFVSAALVCIGTPISAAAALFFTRGVKSGRRKLVITASLLPVACVGWALSVLWVEGTVNHNFLDRDPGYGDMWACPLPDGYAIEMIDDPDFGVLYNPETQKTGRVAWGARFDDPIDQVRLLQLAGPYIFGGVDSHVFDPTELDKKQVDSYFLLDTRTGRHTSFLTYDELAGEVQQLGFEPKLEGIFTVYSRYRFTWFEAFMDLLLSVPPIVGTSLLVRRIIWLRRTRVQSK
jgi:hypothetical protein